MSVQVVVSHHVHDFDKWFQVFDEHGDVRREHGATGHRLYRSLDDPGRVVIVNDFADEAGARAFLTDPSLRDAMERAGVDAPPTLDVCTLAESATY
jgi:quinol monooxygenase YgiN